VAAKKVLLAADTAVMGNRRLPAVFAALSLAVVLGFGVSGAFGGEQLFSGQLIAVHSDDFADHHGTLVYGLKTSAGVLSLRFDGAKPPVPLGSSVTVQGMRSGNTITVAAGGTSSSGSTTTTTTATGVKRLAVVLITFADNTTQPYTPAYARGIAFSNASSVAAYYGTTSLGQLTLSGDVFGWYQLRDKSSTCDYSTWAADANKAASAAGVDLSGYSNIAYAFPTVSSCGWAGLSYMPGTQLWLNGPSGMTVHVMAHELGHNFGTHHANGYVCTENGVRVALSASTANCSSQEYGDPFSVMGNYSIYNHYEHTSFARGNFGWLDAAATLDLTRSGTYTLAALEQATGVRGLRIKRDSSSCFLLEFRQPDASFDTFASTDPAAMGVLIRIVPCSYSIIAQSQLVDATPATTSFNDAALAVGRSLYDPISKFTLTTTAVGTSGATVQISFGADTTDTTPPSTPANLTATAPDARHVNLSWGVSTDNVAVAAYKVYRDGSYLGSTTSTGFTDSGVTATTTYTYAVSALDAVGNQSSDATVTVTTPASTITTSGDTTAPTAPTGLAATRMGNRARVDLSWAPATDNTGIASYRLYRNGALTATVTGGMLSYTDAKAPRGSDSYYVVAVDAAGNAGAPSNTASV
jgi:hypothetical protein